jgi:hypothetical protein
VKGCFWVWQEQLNAEIEAFLKKRQKSNRQLAANVAKWVETAMNTNAELKASGGQDETLIDDDGEDAGHRTENIDSYLEDDLGKIDKSECVIN